MKLSKKAKTKRNTMGRLMVSVYFKEESSAPDIQISGAWLHIYHLEASVQEATGVFSF